MTDESNARMVDTLPVKSDNICVFHDLLSVCQVGTVFSISFSAGNVPKMFSFELKANCAQLLH